MAGMDINTEPVVSTRYVSYMTDQALVTWPKGGIPVEIFAIIVSYLSRSNVQNMRLVNKEFEVKVSQYLFKTVVVPFRPEIYGIAEDPTASIEEGTEKDRQRKLAVMLQDNGMRVFQGFGRHIHRFAMSFEFDYELLTKPPLKSDQEAITTFWGIYRWPYKGYHRYEALEGLEQTADETRTMAKALRYIEKCKELGLSIDGGLGWLAGPDVNMKAQNANERVVVFGESAFRPEEKPMSTSSSSRPLSPPTSSKDVAALAHVIYPGFSMNRQNVDDGGNFRAWSHMLREAGYEGPDLEPSIRTLRESEGLQTVPTSTPSFELASSFDSATSPPSSRPLSLGGTSRESEMTDLLLQRMGFPLLNGVRHERETIEGGQIEFPRTPTRNPATEGSSGLYPLKPNNLTNAQKEMLLETEWAQRAFMQSYAIAVIDNPLTFQKVESLKIARLPSRHLSILKRADFWESLSSLKSVSLAVIPDWRDIVKLPTSWVEDVRLQPSAAIAGAFQILRDHIATKPSITTLHFEWLCGGEEAAGIFARNQHVLAAPLYPQASGMTYRLPREMLSLPYIQHLSLKNCWISPHKLVSFATSLRDQALRSLTLHSISLTSPLDVVIQPAQINANLHGGQLLLPHGPNNTINNGIQQPAMNNPAGVLFPNTVQAQVPPGAPTQQSTGSDSWLEPPRHGSWAHVIDCITPGETLARMRHAREDTGDQPPAPNPTNLRIINFQSCGYVRLPLDIDQSMLDPPEGRQGVDSNTDTAKRRVELEQFMMKPHNDRCLGTITNYLSEEETRTLENAWALRTGWGEGSTAMVAQALADGVKNAGQGRFRGSIMKTPI